MSMIAPGSHETLYDFSMLLGRTGLGEEVWVSIKVERFVRPAETVHHHRISTIERLSIHGRIGALSGQIADRLDEIVDFNLPPDEIARLRYMWSEWNQNDLKPHCAHQISGEPSDPLIRGQVCERSGYVYGSSWLVRPLYTSVMDKIIEWANLFGAAPEGMETPLGAYIREQEIDMSTQALTDVRPSRCSADGAKSWMCVLHRPDGRMLATTFEMGPALVDGDGLARPPTCEEMLRCLATDARILIDSGHDPVALGATLDIPERADAERAYHAICSTTSDLREFLGGDFGYVVFEMDHD